MLRRGLEVVVLIIIIIIIITFVGLLVKSLAFLQSFSRFIHQTAYVLGC